MTERVKLGAPIEVDIELPSGRVARLQELDGRCYQIYGELQRGDPSKIHLVWEVVSRCLPDVPQDEINALTPSQCAEVITLAGNLMHQTSASFGFPKPTH